MPLCLLRSNKKILNYVRVAILDNTVFQIKHTDMLLKWYVLQAVNIIYILATYQCDREANLNEMENTLLLL